MIVVPKSSVTNMKLSLIKLTQILGMIATRYIDNKDGEKVVAHTWNNVVKWGESSNKQPFSHLAIIDISNVNEIFESNLNSISSHHYTLPLTARRVDTIDTDNDGDKEIIYLGNREDGRNRNSSWKDVNYIFDLNHHSLSKFGSSHFSHDLMYLDLIMMATLKCWIISTVRENQVLLKYVTSKQTNAKFPKMLVNLLI